MLNASFDNQEIGNLPILKIPVLGSSRISAVPQLPESLINLCFKTSMETLPNFSNLINLRNLRLTLWFNLEGPSKHEAAPIARWIGTLRMLEFLKLSSPRITTLSSNLVPLSQLKKLELHCPNLQCLPKVPTNLSHLGIKYCRRMKTTNDLSNLKASSDLVIVGCDELTKIQGLEGLENLRTLVLMKLPSLVKLSDLTNLKKLKKIHINDCCKLFKIQCGSESLEMLHIVNCLNLREFPCPSRLRNAKIWIPETKESTSDVFFPRIDPCQHNNVKSYLTSGSQVEVGQNKRWRHIRWVFPASNAKEPEAEPDPINGAGNLRELS